MPVTDAARGVLVVGSLHYDIMVEADHLPRRDETAVGSRWFPVFGGKGGNQAAAARRHGAATRMVGAVGDDDFGRFLRSRLRAAGVADDHVAIVAGAGSGISVAIMDGAGDYAATIVSGANLHIAAAAVRDAAVWNGVAVLVMQNEVPETVNIAAATEARARGVLAVLNAAPFRPLPPALAGLVDILVVNAVEAEMMGTGAVTGLDSAADAARVLAGSFRTVIVTAGSRGLATAGAGGRLRLPAEKVTAVSSHGAGDSFIGALAAALAQQADLRTACAAASHAAAMHVAGLTVRA